MSPINMNKCSQNVAKYIYLYIMVKQASSMNAMLDWSSIVNENNTLHLKYKQEKYVIIFIDVYKASNKID